MVHSRGVARGRRLVLAMAHAKDRHYWTQLRTALTAGNWRADKAAQTPKAEHITWSKLFYKFNKHCRGYQDVAEMAVQTRSLALLLEASADGDEMKLDGEYVLAQERVQAAYEGYQTLSKLESKHSDVRTASPTPSASDPVPSPSCWSSHTMPMHSGGQKSASLT